MLYPGHRYLGPGNPLFNGTPVDNADYIAQNHDWEYSTAKTKEDIFNSDSKAINNFTSDYKQKFNLPSFFGSTGLSIKNSFEKFINHTVYPWNLPSSSSSLSDGMSKRQKTVHNYSGQITPPRESIYDSFDSSSNDTTTNTSGINFTQNTMDPVNMPMSDQPMQGGAGSSDTKGGGGSLHGQTAKIFSTTPQEPSWHTLSFKKTYRWTYKSELPAIKSNNGVPLFRIGSAIDLPVDRVFSYLSPEEIYRFKHNYEYVELLHAECDVFNYGIRLPFATNDSSSITANASAQYPLTQWIGLEEDYNLFHDYTDVVLKMVGGFDLPDANQTTWKEDLSNLSARATSREYSNPACIIIPYETQRRAFCPNTNEYAHSINGTMNLGHVFHWEHKIKHGLICQRHHYTPVNNTLPYGDLISVGNRIFMAPDNINAQSKIKVGSRNIYHGLDQLSDERIQNAYKDMSIDGWLAYPSNNNNAHQVKIKPFIVGMQHLRNKDDSLLVADWEFATDFKITVRVKTGTRGIYSQFFEHKAYTGIDPLVTYSEDGQFTYPSNTYDNRGHQSYTTISETPPAAEAVAGGSGGSE